jgi:biopolymer transport protein TolQ
MNNVVSFNFFDMIANSDTFSKFLYVLLVGFSIWSWAIAFDKIFKFRMLKIKTEKFDRLFWSGKVLEDIYKQVKTSPNYPSALIFIAAMREWETSNVLAIVKNNDAGKKDSLKERIAGAMDIALAKSMTKLKYGLNFLLIVSTTSTLFGLFGTVWGFVKTFSAVAAFQDTSLVVLAPGISSDFTTTIFGLIAAIPATIFYNVYSSKLNEFEDQMYNFSSEVLIILSRELDQ